MPPGKPASHAASNRTPGPWRQHLYDYLYLLEAGLLTTTEELTRSLSPGRAPTLAEDAPQAGVGGTVLQLKPRWAAPRRPAGPAVTSRPKTEPGGSGRENSGLLDGGSYALEAKGSGITPAATVDSRQDRAAISATQGRRRPLTGELMSVTRETSSWVGPSPPSG